MIEYPVPPAVEEPPMPSTGHANRIYLLLVVLLVATSLLSSALPAARWLLVLGGEPVMLLVILLATRREQRPWRQALRWNWPGVRMMGLGLSLGLCAFTLATLIQIIVLLIFGETTGVDIREFASDPVMLVTFVVSAVILAPLCEELIFRGYLLGIYERYLGYNASLWLVSLLFAGLHLQLLGVFGLLPVSFLLTYVAMRGGSIVTCIAAHFAFNLVGTMIGLLSINSSPLVAGVLMCSLMVIGPVAGLYVLQVFRHLQPEPAPLAPVRLEKKGAWLGRVWPILIALLVYIFFAGFEVITNYYPQVLADPMPILRAPGRPLPTRLVYIAQTWVPNGNQPKITCNLSTEGALLNLDCQRQIPKSWFNPGSTLAWKATWQEDTMQLQSARYTAENWTAEVTQPGGAGLVYQLAPADANRPRDLAPNALLDALWPWHLMGLPFQNLDRLGVKTQQMSLNSNGDADLQEVAIRYQSKEQISTPAGEYSTWKVRVGHDTAWYDTQSPHLPVQFTWDGMTYELAP
jgi:membrane protease YdiL (CAAX protease family)